MDKEGPRPQTLGRSGGEGTAALQDVSRPIFRRSALENTEESVVLLVASWQLPFSGLILT